MVGRNKPHYGVTLLQVSTIHMYTYIIYVLNNDIASKLMMIDTFT